MTIKINSICFLFLVLIISNVYSQVLETEESKPLLAGQFEIGTGLEFQTSSAGTETALPIAIEYGLSKKFTLLVEPVVFTSINPKSGTNAKGIGDWEVTLFYQITPEKKSFPSISVAGEIKVPTAKNSLIGTTKTDYSLFLIASKTLGKFYTSANISYTFLGKPDGVVANDLINYALGSVYTVSSKSILFAEVYGNTSAVGEGESPESENPSKVELSGGELVGAIGYGYYLQKNLLLSFGINYDNNNAILFRPGIEWKF